VTGALAGRPRTKTTPPARTAQVAVIPETLTLFR
jgi:hypothetical protein